MFDLTVIGNGIAANLFLMEFYKNHRNKRVLQIFENKICPTCSTSNTGTVFLPGVEPNVSPLGDIIYNSFLVAKDFFERNNPAGVEKAPFFYLCHGEKDSPEEFKRRFQSVEEVQPLFNTKLGMKSTALGKVWNGFIIDPIPFLNYLLTRKLDVANGNLEIREDLVVGLQKEKTGLSLQLLGGQLVRTRRLVLCTGAYTKTFEAILPQNQVISKSKIVPGSYLEKEGVDLGEHSFSIYRKGQNLVYHGKNKKLVLGATRQKEGIEACDFTYLKEVFENFKELLGHWIPPLESFEIRSGNRAPLGFR